MGRILTPPKPKRSSPSPQVIYYAPAPSTPTPTPKPTTSDSDANTPTPGKTDAEVASERAENILRRNRSRLGTILTSFRGVLSGGATTAARKTLLGE